MYHGNEPAVDNEKEVTTDVKMQVPTPRCYIKCRHVLAVMLFFALFNLYTLRVNINVAIVAMVNFTTEININYTDACPDRGASSIDNTESNGIFSWDRNQQGLILGCYYYGYIVTNIPGGYLTGRFGIKPVLGISMLFASIITILTPLIAYTSFNLFVASRVVLGFLQGICFPAMQAAWGRWAPPSERTFLIATSFAGTSVGIFITFSITGAVAENFGWEAAFYVTGCGALLWTFIWFGIIHSWPEDHPRISLQERAYITESIGVRQDTNSKCRKTPWFKICTSIHVWAIIINLSCNTWGTYTLLSMLPTYMATILRFSLAESGGLSAIPYILNFIVTLAVAYISDIVRRRGIFETLTVRKINTTIAAMLPAALIVLAGYVGCNVSAAVAFFSIAKAFTAFATSGAECNAVDLAPEFSGIIYGISNTVANIPGFLAPQVIGMMLQKDPSLNQWRNVFWVTAAVYTFGTAFYLIFSSAEQQPWGNTSANRCSNTENKEIKNKIGAECDLIKVSPNDV